MLLDQGILSMVTKNTTSEGVASGSNLAYTAIQPYEGKTGKGHSVTIDPRPYLVVQEEDLEEIAIATEEFLKQLF